MMLLRLILLQLLAHLLSDFVLQPHVWSIKKSLKIISRYHVYHMIVVGIMSYLLSFDIGFWKAALTIALLHLIMDVIKSFLQLKDKTKNKEKTFFFYDQLIHIAVFIIISYAYSNWYNINFLVDFKIKTIAVITGFILCAKPANLIIKNLFIVFSINVPLEEGIDNIDKSLPNAGKLIGIAERLLALTLFLIGEYEAVGLIIAAKSILRFNGTQKSEYVLVGTLISFGIAAFSGILINLL